MSGNNEAVARPLALVVGDHVHVVDGEHLDPRFAALCGVVVDIEQHGPSWVCQIRSCDGRMTVLTDQYLAHFGARLVREDEPGD
jgi:hypothetical protein